MPESGSMQWVQEKYPPGIMYRNPDALTDCQTACIERTGMTVQLEQNAYLRNHPEIGAMLNLYVSKVALDMPKKGYIEVAETFFKRPTCLIEDDVRKYLDVAYGEPYSRNYPPFYYKDLSLENDLFKLNAKHHPVIKKVPSTPSTASETVSSSFLSIVTSKTTIPTPEPVKTPEPTLSETLFSYIELSLNKAVFLNVKEYQLLYDTAYVEMMRIVEEAMEITVIGVKEDIATLFFNAYQLFEIDIMEKERIAAELAWERRMRKKMKKTYRRQDNFKGYETPPSKSEVSSHASYKIPPLHPCECHPQHKYNRYAKDRFGIYIPRKIEFSDGNVTVTPAVSIDEHDDDNAEADTKSVSSRKKKVEVKEEVEDESNVKQK